MLIDPRPGVLQAEFVSCVLGLEFFAKQPSAYTLGLVFNPPYLPKNLILFLATSDQFNSNDNMKLLMSGNVVHGTATLN
jgi:hypothetical protein